MFTDWVLQQGPGRNIVCHFSPAFCRRGSFGVDSRGVSHQSQGELHVRWTRTIKTIRAITIRITGEARLILEESSRRLGLYRSSFVELAIRAKARQVDQQ